MLSTSVDEYGKPVSNECFDGYHSDCSNIEECNCHCHRFGDIEDEKEK